MAESMEKRATRTKPSWSDVKARLASFNRAELLALVQSLYAASRDNQAFLHARLDLGNDPIAPYKETISRWIYPDVYKGQDYSITPIRSFSGCCFELIAGLQVELGLERVDLIGGNGG